MSINKTLPYRGLLGSVVPQGYSSAKFNGEGFLYCTKQKLLSFLEGAGLSCDWKEAAAGRQRTTPYTLYISQLDGIGVQQTIDGRQRQPVSLRKSSWLPPA